MGRPADTEARERVRKVLESPDFRFVTWAELARQADVLPATLATWRRQPWFSRLLSKILTHNAHQAEDLLKQSYLTVVESIVAKAISGSSKDRELYLALLRALEPKKAEKAEQTPFDLLVLRLEQQRPADKPVVLDLVKQSELPLEN